ncbi:MAG TPA: hypothetical protein DIC64_04325 [Alphaproteobacteria bacterium]|nr:hypothetical protein [Alphaproteobacteria bacterium]
MVKKNFKKYLILFVSIIFVWKLLSIRIIDLRFSKVCPIVQTSDVISAKEAELFLKQWGEYAKRGYMAKVPEEFAFDNEATAERIPWIVKLWFEKNCINPQRFYYTEQRLRTILKAYELKKHTLRVIDVLESQIQSDMSESQKQWYQDLIEEQKQMSKVEGIRDEELAIVEGRDSQIREILR